MWNKRHTQKAHLLCERKNLSHGFCPSSAGTAQQKQTHKISESYKCFRRDDKHVEIRGKKT